MKKALLPLLLVIPLVACNFENNPTSFEFQLSDLGNSVEFHTELQVKYINSEEYTTTMGIASGSTSKEYPLPIKLSFKGEANNLKKAASSNKDFEWVANYLISEIQGIAA